MNSLPTTNIAVAQLNPHVGALTANSNKIISWSQRAAEQGAAAIVFPELALTGYPPEDLLLRPAFIKQLKTEVIRIAENTSNLTVILGCPWQQSDDTLQNCALVLQHGEIHAVYAKQILPNEGVFDEKRYFTPGNSTHIVTVDDIKLGLLICEDLWHTAGPAQQAKQDGADALITLNASPFTHNKAQARQAAAKARHEETQLSSLYVNMIGGQDDVVFDGGSFALNTNTEIAWEAPCFIEDMTLITATRNSPEQVTWSTLQQLALPQDTSTVGTCLALKESNWAAHAYNACVLGIRDYAHKNGFSKAVLGVSGGIDSALVLAMAADALGAKNVLGLLMPSTYTSDLSRQLATQLLDNIGAYYQEHNITAPYHALLESLDINNTPVEGSLTSQNLQARCRGALLMAVSNQHAHLVLATGNKSELAVGYSTLYGDMVGGFYPLKDVYKTEVYKLAVYRNTLGEKALIPEGIISRPPTAELAPDQSDQDTLPPYDVLDNILNCYIELNLSAEDIIAQGIESDIVQQVIAWVRRAEYKRQQAAPGVMLHRHAFGRARRYPITNGWND